MLPRAGLLGLIAVLLVGCASATASPQGQATASGLLAARGVAVLAHDATAMARTSAPSATPAVRELATRTATLPLTRWVYAVEVEVPGPVAGERTVTAVLHYRLATDGADVTARRHLVLATASAAAGWQLVADDPVGAALPWDVGRVVYAAQQHAAALATTTTVDALGLAAQAGLAEAAVSTMWGSGWSRSPVVVGVAGPRDLAALTGRSAAAVRGLVAVSTPDRVYVDLAAYAGLSAAGRRVLLTHEVVHLATRSGADLAVPGWLKEGFADYVGFLGSGIGTGVAAASLLDRVRRSGPPAMLPGDSAFDPAAGSAASGYVPADAYSAAWIACRMIATDVGSAGLARVYRATSVGAGEDEANADVALRQVTRHSLAWWTQRWRDELSVLAR